MTKDILKNYTPEVCPFCKSENTDVIDSDDTSEKRICRHCSNDYIVVYSDVDSEIITDITTRNGFSIKYSWKDIVLYNGKLYAFDFPISGEIDRFEDDDFAWQIDDFIESAAKELNCTEADIMLYTMDEIKGHDDEFKDLPLSISECGAYINNLPEWAYV